MIAFTERSQEENKTEKEKKKVGSGVVPDGATPSPWPSLLRPSEIETSERNEPCDLVIGKTEGYVVDDSQGEQLREHQHHQAEYQTSFQEGYDTQQKFHEEIPQPLLQDEGPQTVNEIQESCGDVSIQQVRDEEPDSHYITQESHEDEAAIESLHAVQLYGLQRDQIQGHEGTPLTYIEGTDYVLYSDEPIGEGSYGKCYEAVGCKEKKRICVKVIKINNKKDFEDACKEATIMSKPSPHEHICPTYFGAVYIPPDTFHIFMELMRGGTLEDHIQKCKERFEERDVQNIITQLTCLIDKLHRSGVAHWDLKACCLTLSADNVLMRTSADDVLMGMKVCDFGNSSARCQLHTTFNKPCDTCYKWKKGCADDIREIGYLACRLLYPESANSYRNQETETILENIKDSKWKHFIGACLKLESSHNCLQILKRMKLR